MKNFQQPSYLPPAVDRLYYGNTQGIYHPRYTDYPKITSLPTTYINYIYSEVHRRVRVISDLELLGVRRVDVFEIDASHSRSRQTAVPFQTLESVVPITLTGDPGMPQYLIQTHTVLGIFPQ